MKTVLLLLFCGLVASVPGPTLSNLTVWHLVWTGGQSNSIGTNSQRSGYPMWPTTDRIQSFNWQQGTFKPAAVPLSGENNVGFSQTFANLLLPTLPKDHGVIVMNTGVGGTGFSDGRWVVPDGDLTKQSISAVDKLAATLPSALGGSYVFHAMLWHQVGGFSSGAKWQIPYSTSRVMLKTAL
jgi:hypothetical protein